MNPLLEAVIESLTMFNRVYFPKDNAETAEITPIWFAAISDVPGVTPEIVKTAALDVIKTHSDYWPKPAQLRAFVLSRAAAESAYRRAIEYERLKALPEPEPITPERKAEVLATFPERTRRFIALVLGSEDRKTHSKDILKISENS